MQRPKFVVRWDDRDGKKHRREYDKELEARKARDWLLLNGAPSADIAIKMGERETSTTPPESSMFPTKEAPIQQNFI